MLKLPPPPARVFLVGIGGIGMSGLAQMLKYFGYEVAGSDRNLDSPAQKKLFDLLKQQSIEVFPQDGKSAFSYAPECLILSSAVEEDNPDLQALPQITRIHRSQALYEAVVFSKLPSIAVAGSCGKTSVTAWIHSALSQCGKSTMLLNGGYSLDHNQGEQFPGNFLPGDDLIVFEADESDGSLVNYTPDIGLLLNLGDDHHSEDKLKTMFHTFLSQCKQAAIVADELQYLAAAHPNTLTVKGDGQYSATSIELDSQGAFFQCLGKKVRIPQQGEHSVENSLFVLATLLQCDIEMESAIDSLNAFRGVHRRLEFCGKFKGRPIFDDYAHNPQKIAAIIRTVQNSCKGGIDILFQPHGYGPLGFMREALLRELEESLLPQSRFIFLPVFYAGGSTSFSPTSQEVCQEFNQKGNKNYQHSTKEDICELLNSSSCNAVLVLGARDPDLNNWARSLNS